MIHIDRPLIEAGEKETVLKAKIHDEARNKTFELWYSVQNEYGKYLCSETADAFVLLMLELAMQSGQDIVSDAPVSAKLLFNIENTIKPLHEKAMPEWKHINIKAEPHFGGYENEGAVGCCCSLGVDSFSSFLKQYGPEAPEGYRITHLTLFNSGQLGYEKDEETEAHYYETLEGLKPFADEVGLPIVGINSNLNSVCRDSEVTLLQGFIFRTLSCVLAMQKLFGKYVFSSSYSVEDFQLSDYDHSHMEAIFVPLLGTESLEMILSNPTMTRVEKTRFLSQFPITTKYLDVCWSAQFAYGQRDDATLFKNKTKKNCGCCDKCMRTMLTLDVMGKLADYEGLFDMDNYRRKKNSYVGAIFLNEDNKVFYRELKELLLQNGYKPSLSVRARVFKNSVPAVRSVFNCGKKIVRSIKH